MLKRKNARHVTNVETMAKNMWKKKEFGDGESAMVYGDVEILQCKEVVDEALDIMSNMPTEIVESMHVRDRFVNALEEMGLKV